MHAGAQLTSSHLTQLRIHRIGNDAADSGQVFPSQSTLITVITHQSPGEIFFSSVSRLCQPTITVCSGTGYPWRESQLPFFYLLPVQPGPLLKVLC